MRNYCIKCLKWVDPQNEKEVTRRYFDKKIKLPGCKICGHATIEPGELPLSIARIAIKDHQVKEAEIRAMLLKHGRTKLQIRKVEQKLNQETENNDKN